jgi:hypothetical protein
MPHEACSKPTQFRVLRIALAEASRQQDTYIGLCHHLGDPIGSKAGLLIQISVMYPAAQLHCVT